MQLGPYEIVTAIGAGGMGEVYRARDTRLGRDVAAKVLPETFSPDAERMGRFRREAQVLASLNHPNIAAIYGFEDSSKVTLLFQVNPNLQYVHGWPYDVSADGKKFVVDTQSVGSAQERLTLVVNWPTLLKKQ